MKSILKDNNKLREALRTRWKELKKSQKEVAEDAQKRGQAGIRRQGVNRYLNDPENPNTLNEYQILWLATRWGIDVRVIIGPARIKEMKIPKFNETEALKKLEDYENTQRTGN